jgi:hypothetical protein
MARGKTGVGTYIVIAIGGLAVVVLLDHYVLKGRLGISGHFNIMIGQIKKLFGSGAGPITASDPTDPTINQGETGLSGGQFEGSPEEAALLEKEQEIAAREPETAMWARLKARKAARRRFYH